MFRFLAVITLALGAASAPALAEHLEDEPVDGAFATWDRFTRLSAGIQAGIGSGTIKPADGRVLRDELQAIRDLGLQYSSGGLDRQEKADLQQRLRNYRESFRKAGGTGYGSGEHGEAGAGGLCRPKSAGDDLAAAIDGVFGHNAKNCVAALRVGEKAGGYLWWAPREYREYRDGNGVYYRTDGERVYQIDNRTNVVIRVDTLKY